MESISDRDFARHSGRSIDTTSIHKHRFVWFTFVWIALICVVVSLVLKIYQPTQLFVFAVTEYQAPLPPNAWAYEDWVNLRSISNGVDEPSVAQTRIDFDKQIDSFLRNADSRLLRSPFDDRQQAILFYISALGVVDSEGQPGLLMMAPGGAGAFESDGSFSDQSFYPLADLLERIRSEPGIKEARKFILLDAVKFHENWMLGITQNPFAESLETFWRSNLGLFDDICIVNSTLPGQIGRSAPERGGTAFGTFFVEAMSGTADKDGNELLSGEELVNFMKDSVNRWANKFRADEQEVLVLHSDEFNLSEVTVCSVRSKNAWTPTARPPKPSPDLNKIAEKFSRLDYATSATHKPIQLASFQRSLARLESLWQAGPYYAEGDLFKLELKNAKDCFSLLSEVPSFDIPFVGVGIARSEPSSNSAQEARKWLLAKNLEKKTDIVQQDSEIEGKTKKEEVPIETDKQSVPEYHAVAQIVWEKFLDPGSNMEPTASAKEIGQVVRDLPHQVEAKEIFLLRLLERAKDIDMSQRQEIGSLFDLGERASNPPDLRAVKWIKDECSVIDERFRTRIFDAIFCDKESIENAFAKEFKPVLEDYEGLKKLGDDLSESYRSFDRFCSAFGWLGEFSIANNWEPRDWTSLIEQLSDYQVDQLVKEDQVLESPADVLELFRSYAKEEAETRSGITARNISDYEALLRVPIPFDGREDIRKKLIDHFATLDTPVESRLVSRTAIDSREHPLLLLLDLDSNTSVSVREKIQDVWNQTRNESTAISIRAALARITAPLLSNEHEPSARKEKADVVADEFVDAGRAYHHFQAERIERDFWGDLGQRDYFFANSLKTLQQREKLDQLLQTAEHWTPIVGTTEYVDDDSLPKQASFSWRSSTGNFPDGIVNVRIEGGVNRGIGSHEVLGTPIRIDAAFDQTVTATAFFRGHARTERSSLQKRIADQVSEVRFIKAPSSVRVDVPERSVDIVFVIDCSATMREGEQQENRPQERVNIASEAMDAVWNMLATDTKTDFHVGFVLFGHRNYWERIEENGKFERYEHVTKSGETKVLPGDDVESFPVASVKKGDWFKIKQKLDAKGESPLYYSMSEACALLDESGGSREKFLVVLTDGDDNVTRNDTDSRLEFNTSNFSSSASVNLSQDVQCLIFLINKKAVDLTSGFGHNPYVRILDDNSNLVDPLRRAFGLKVEFSGDENRETYRLGEWFSVWPSAGEKFRISLIRGDEETRIAASEDFELSYGEKRSFRPDASLVRLIPDETPEEGFVEPFGDRKNQDYRCFVRTSRSGESIKVDVAFKSTGIDSEFVAPPRHVRAEIWDNNNPDRRYYFLDRSLGDGFSSPFLRFSVDDWVGGKQMMMKLLYTDDDSQLQMIDISNGSLEVEVEGEQVEVRVTKSSSRLVLDETHRGDTDWVPLQIESMATADRVTRQRFDREHRVTTVFQYGAGLASDARLVLGDLRNWQSFGVLTLAVQGR